MKASVEELGSSASKAIALMNKLRECGADSEIDIPRIAFAGKQSAGKSSIVEALTGVSILECIDWQGLKQSTDYIPELWTGSEDSLLKEVQHGSVLRDGVV